MAKKNSLQEEFEKEEADLAREFEREELERSEGNYGKKAIKFADEYLGKAMQGLAPLASVVDKVATPITESIRAPLKYIAENVGENTSQTPPIDVAAPYRQWGASDRVGLGLAMTDLSNAMGIKQSPLIDDLGNAEVYAPNASAMVKHLSNPAELGGVALELGLGLRGTGNVGRIAGNPIGTAIDATKAAGGVLKEIPGTMRNYGGKAGQVIGSGIGDLFEYIGTPFTAAAEYFDGKFADRNMARNYIEATAENRQLLAELKAKNPQAIEDMVDMILANKKVMNPFNKGAYLDSIEGPVVTGENGRLVRDSSLGSINQYADIQNSLIQDLEKANIDKNYVQLDELAERAKQNLGGMEMTDGQATSASNLIDEIIGQQSPDPVHLARIKRNQDLRWRSASKTNESTMELNDILSGRRNRIADLEESSSAMPDQIPNPEYSQDVITGEFRNSPTIVNEEKIAMLQEMDLRAEQLSEEMRFLERKIIPDAPDYERYRDLVYEFENIVQEMNRSENLTNDMTVDQYYTRLHGLNQQPSVQSLNEIRKKGNRFIREGQAIGVDPIDAAARTNAGKAAERAATEGLYSLEGFEEGTALRSSYEGANRAIHARRNFQDLNPLARTDKGLSGALVPQGRMDTGIAARALNMMDTTIAPLANRASDVLSGYGVRTSGMLNNPATQQLATMPYKIARDSNKAFEEREQIAQLLMQEMGAEFAEDFYKVSSDPDAIKVFMRQLEAIRPDLFEKDRYGRIDGEIADPALKKAAMTDMMMDRKISPIDRANKLQDLLVKGRYS